MQDPDNHFAEAKIHREASDYEAAIHLIEAIPDGLRTTEMRSYLRQLHSDFNESRVLIRTIADRIKTSALDGLLDDVARAVELRGDRGDLRKLHSQLTERQMKLNRENQDAASKAEELLKMGHAREALARIQAIPAQDICERDLKLKNLLLKLVKEEDKIAAIVKTSRTKGLMDDKEVESLLNAVAGYLEKNPRHLKIKQLKEQLLERRRKLTGDVPAMPLTVQNSIGMELKLIQPGTFLMSGTFNKARDPTHQVTLTKAFYIGVTPVTQEQYESVMGTNPSAFQGASNPVERISWSDAVAFCRRLSELPAEGRAKHIYRLPTEAEWEYACRAGTTTAYSFGHSKFLLSEYAWFAANSNRRTHPVGKKKSNSWGLFDMHGNVSEWCNDWHRMNLSSDLDTLPKTDPEGPGDGGPANLKVHRGGGWKTDALQCNSWVGHGLSMSSSNDQTGIRVALVPPNEVIG